ncbi:hypothetical protein SAMN05192558_104132 [Actinokineospora alba]|uniref:Uncharacterized protein n=1 Tax=Actinokineospora alba TaxID=504798 RepID=A0A1H0LGC0_9PSEU|nr:hypothetical protein [Actinokineospora alba]TDP67313.1 hypothetical protein C8E96_2851 [Actinokineospora alba]SDJ00706.1 hypothetical protein SAMN05421871_109165 [Actinokineospora alba]SDO67051.1 hypothetical protein SAMN05192558_104132 [Actinokineospora alba]
MPQSDQPARRTASHGPKRRGDSTRPAGRLPGGERRPYPTAATTTRVSPAKPGSTTRGRSRGSAATPTPATVWTAGGCGIDLDAAWPTPLVEKIVAAFSAPGGRVALLPWPTSNTTSGRRRGFGVVDPDGVIRHAPDGTSGDAADGELSAALDAVEHLGRHGRVVRAAAPEESAGPVSRPFWADLIGDPTPPSAVVPTASPHGFDTVSPDADLVITSLPPADAGDRVGDVVALLAARLLRVGGILAVLTHSDWSGGELVDPTGAVVAAAQNADLLYLQHVVALHVPVRDGRFATELLPDADGSAAERRARTEHRAVVRGLPAPHTRIHSDVLVFAQPHEHEPPPASPVDPAAQAPQTGGAR